MGTPAADEPWRWQLDGHHLVIYYFLLKDQIVMTSTFRRSEPVRADTGKDTDARVFHTEEQKSLARMRALTLAQRQQAILSRELPREIFTAAFRDNFELQYAGIRYDALSAGQQALRPELIETDVSNVRPGHAEIRMAEVQ